MALWMNGLRVYLIADLAEPEGSTTVFYSRRANGPYYLWRYEEKMGQWRFSRMNTNDAAPKPLSLASWKNIPPELQKKLGEHYLE